MWWLPQYTFDPLWRVRCVRGGELSELWCCVVSHVAGRSGIEGLVVKRCHGVVVGCGVGAWCEGR